MDNQDRVICYICGLKYASLSSRNKHLRNIHKQDYSIIKKNILTQPENKYAYRCLDKCGVSFSTNVLLIDHLRLVHAMNIPATRFLTFNSYNEFLQWLEVEQKENLVRYSKFYTKKGMKKDVTYFKCSRTSRLDNIKKRLDQVRQQRKRNLKSQGYSKIIGACTSYITVSLDKASQACKVSYNAFHYGHKSEIQHLRLLKSDREILAGKIIEGLTSSRILDDFGNNTATDLERINLTRKDLHNIKSSFNINTDHDQSHVKNLAKNPVGTENLQKSIIEEINLISRVVPSVVNKDNLNLCLKLLRNISAVLASADKTTNKFKLNEVKVEPPANKKIKKLANDEPKCSKKTSNNLELVVLSNPLEAHTYCGQL